MASLVALGQLVSVIAGVPMLLGIGLGWLVDKLRGAIIGGACGLLLGGWLLHLVAHALAYG